MDHRAVANPQLRLCFVCLGNICRSPTAEGVMLQLLQAQGLAERFQVDSAGTAAYHLGKRPDPRTLAAAARRGVALPSLARQFQRGDFARFDYVLAMDGENLSELRALAPDADARQRLHLLRSFEPGAAAVDVPDPYYGGAQGFETVLDICERACAGLLRELRERHGL
jgi:protein-tyrosine phosphatase